MPPPTHTPVPGELPKQNSTVSPSSTPAPTVQPHSCPDGEFVCGAHGECVADSKVCDFRRDCSDGSDELNCGKSLIFSLNSCRNSAPPVSTFLASLFMQWSNIAILKVAKRAAGRASTPLWPRSMHFVGHQIKGRAFTMGRSTTVL